MNDKYVAHYQISDPKGEVIYQGEIGVTHQSDADLGEESKETVANAIFWELGVEVTKLEKK